MTRTELLKSLKQLDEQLKENVKNYSHMCFYENKDKKREILFIVTTGKKLLKFNITDCDESEIVDLIVKKLDRVRNIKRRV